MADQRWRRRCRNRQRCDIRHCSCELQLVKSFAREAEYHRRIRRTIARKLLYRQHYGAHVRARVRTEKRKLRIPEVHQQRSRSPGRFSFLFLSFLSSFFFLIFFSLEWRRLVAERRKSEHRRGLRRLGIPRLWVGIHKIFVRRLTTTTRASLFFVRVKYIPGHNILPICSILVL